ncbi:MAG: entericidin EcnA/B family protein [Alphaproteobacteria bacterium]|nr:entericidin EcnA/B family protein [Alphaproteobacteria bacterium]MBV9372811.1 entericidin EcnA/B family protein [Alphaproteobacteria bacterium]MBV9900494.1 entericidin EcnA/B family protein [Alphaproteobacteria bacterium]
MARKTLTTLLISTAIFAIAACNTVRGAGEDVKSASNSVENAMH